MNEQNFMANTVHSSSFCLSYSVVKKHDTQSGSYFLIDGRLSKMGNKFCNLLSVYMMVKINSVISCLFT